MKLSYFREFIALSGFLNFSVTAHHLHMTQPGLSRHISELEKALEVKLLERDTHKVRLTAEGEQFSKGIQKIIDDYDCLCATITKIGLEKITIGVPYYGVRKYLSHIISLFESANPTVQINYLPAYPDEIITGLFSKKVDVAILPRVDFFNSQDLIFHDAFKESVVVLLNRNHRLATRESIQAIDLLDECFISLAGFWGDALFEDWCKFCQRHGFPPPRKKETHSIEEAALSIKSDSGVMLLPGHLKEANISGNITCVNILDADCSLPISLVRHPENQKPIIDQFISFYLKHSDQ